MDLLLRRRNAMCNRENVLRGYQIIGNPTISDNILQTNGLGGILIPYRFEPGAQVWDIMFRIRINNFQDWGTVLGTRDEQGNRIHSLALQTRIKTISVFLSSNGTSWNIANNNISSFGAPYVWHRLKLSFTGSAYILYYHEGTDYVEWLKINSTSKIYNNGLSGLISFGQWFDNNVFYNDFLIDLTETQIKINNEIWWKAV